MTGKERGIHYNRGRPHSSLGPGLPDPTPSRVPANHHRHKLPAGYHVVKRSVLGGLHHEYSLVKDPGETDNLAEKEPEVVKWLQHRMYAHIAKREKETGRKNPIDVTLDWHGLKCGAFKSSQQAYDSMYIGSPNTAKDLQAKDAKEKEAEAKKLKELETQRGAKLK